MQRIFFIRETDPRSLMSKDPPSFGSRFQVDGSLESGIHIPGLCLPPSNVTTFLYPYSALPMVHQQLLDY